MATKATNQIDHLFQVLGRAETLRRTLAATAKLRTYIQQDKESRLSEKGQKLKELCISMGRPGIFYAKMCSILIDEDLSIKNVDAMFPFVKWSSIIPTEANGHKYPVGQMCVVLIDNNASGSDSVRAIKFDGMLGDNISLHQKSIRIPSDKEVISQINEIFDALVEKGLSDEGFSEEVMKKYKA